MPLYRALVQVTEQFYATITAESVEEARAKILDSNWDAEFDKDAPDQYLVQIQGPIVPFVRPSVDGGNTNG